MSKCGLQWQDFLGSCYRPDVYKCWNWRYPLAYCYFCLLHNSIQFHAPSEPGHNISPWSRIQMYSRVNRIHLLPPVPLLAYPLLAQTSFPFLPCSSYCLSNTTRLPVLAVVASSFTCVTASHVHWWPRHTWHHCSTSYQKSGTSIIRNCDLVVA